MRKALNFDLDTKKYEEVTGKHAPTAYAEIKQFLKRNNFEHRQGSGYISKESLNDFKIFAIIQNMSMELEWFRKCVRQIDVTNIGKQHSLYFSQATSARLTRKCYNTLQHFFSKVSISSIVSKNLLFISR